MTDADVKPLEQVAREAANILFNLSQDAGPGKDIDARQRSIMAEVYRGIDAALRVHRTQAEQMAVLVEHLSRFGRLYMTGELQVTARGFPQHVATIQVGDNSWVSEARDVCANLPAAVRAHVEEREKLKAERGADEVFWKRLVRLTPDGSEYYKGHPNYMIDHEAVVAFLERHQHSKLEMAKRHKEAIEAAEKRVSELEAGEANLRTIARQRVDQHEAVLSSLAYKIAKLEALPKRTP